jgi:hypothetical protein
MSNLLKPFLTDIYSPFYTTSVEPESQKLLTKFLQMNPAKEIINNDRINSYVDS